MCPHARHTACITYPAICQSHKPDYNPRFQAMARFLVNRHKTVYFYGHHLAIFGINLVKIVKIHGRESNHKFMLDLHKYINQVDT